MKNRTFHGLLRRQGYTVSRLAAAIGSNRAHLTETLNNTPGHGGKTRGKVLRFFRREFPEHAELLRAALGWRDESRGTKNEPRHLSYVEQSVPRGTA